MVQEVYKRIEADPNGPVTYSLSVAPSVNKLARNVPGRGRVKTGVYRAWIKGEKNALIAQRARLFKHRASIGLILPETSRTDTDATLKATIDLLVRTGVLKDDSPAYVGALSVSFADQDAMTVTLTPMPAQPHVAKQGRQV